MARAKVLRRCAGCGKSFMLNLRKVGGFYTGTLCVACHNELVKRGFIKKGGNGNGKAIQNNKR